VEDQESNQVPEQFSPVHEQENTVGGFSNSTQQQSMFNAGLD
jgi:hypothetical protein